MDRLENYVASSGHVLPKDTVKKWTKPYLFCWVVPLKITFCTFMDMQAIKCCILLGILYYFGIYTFHYALYTIKVQKGTILTTEKVQFYTCFWRFSWPEWNQTQTFVILCNCVFMRVLCTLISLSCFLVLSSGHLSPTDPAPVGLMLILDCQTLNDDHSGGLCQAEGNDLDLLWPWVELDFTCSVSFLLIHIHFRLQK